MTTPTFPERFNLADYYLFDRLREGRGGRVALRFGEHTFTYAQVAERAERVATALRRAGLPRGGRVFVVLRDIPAFAWVFFGGLRAGGVVAMGNPDAPVDSLAYVVGYTRASVVVAPPRVLAELGREIEAAGGAPELEAVFAAHEPATGEAPTARCEGELAMGAIDLEAAITAAGEGEPYVAATHRDEPAIWLFTSGSTGKPKAAMHAHRDFAFHTEVFAKGTMGLRETDVHVSVPRLFFGYATGTNLMFPFAVGAQVGMFAERPTPASIIAAVEAYRPTVMTLVPTMMGKLLDHDAELRAAGRAGLDLSSVRLSYSAGEALPQALLERWQARFGSGVYDGIGSAEMFHIYASNRPGDVRPGSLGKVVDGYELAVLPEEATAAGGPRLGPGEIGVLWVRGESAASGYWLDRDKSFETFHGKWCRTGDLFHFDDEGYLYFDGRADDLLKVSGIFVSPLEVEECLLQHEAVSAAAVIGANDEGLVKPKCFVVVGPSHAARVADAEGRAALRADLKDHVKARLAKHKYPRFVVFVDDLPRNDRGKIDRKSLRDREGRGENPGES